MNWSHNSGIYLLFYRFTQKKWVGRGSMAVMLSFLFVESVNEKGSHGSVGDARIAPPSSCRCADSRDNTVILQFLVAGNIVDAVAFLCGVNALEENLWWEWGGWWMWWMWWLWGRSMSCLIDSTHWWCQLQFDVFENSGIVAVVVVWLLAPGWGRV